MVKPAHTTLPGAALPASGVMPYRPRDFLRLLICMPFFWMLNLLVIEAGLAAMTTWLVIQAGRDLANEAFLIADFAWIVAAQSAAYVVGACSWIFAERTGFGAYGRYMLQFAKDGKKESRVFANRAQREKTEPFLTNETFHIFFELVYELEADLKLFFNLLFNTIVLGIALDAGLPLVYAAVFAVLLTLQISLRKWLSRTYARNQQATNRMTAHTYTAWDNIFSGNRYNFRLWHSGFKQRLRAALRAQTVSIMAREGIAAVGGIFALLVVFAYLALIAGRNVDNAALLIALAATLPRQIDLSYNVHGLATGWNDLLAVWTRIKGACEAMRPAPDVDFESRIRFDRLALHYFAATGSSAEEGQQRDTNALAGGEQQILQCAGINDAVAWMLAHPTGQMQVRGGNGAGKSTLLAALKTRLGVNAFYWPTTDQLAFAFMQPAKGEALSAADSSGDSEDDGLDANAIMDVDIEAAVPSKAGTSPIGSASAAPPAVAMATSAPAYSSGEQQLSALREIVARTDARFYLLDEWDANLDAKNQAEARKLVAALASRALVVEISHRR